MEPYLTITQMNDFIFCPRSIYFHNIYRNTTTEDVYHQTPQKEGRAVHEAIDQHHYSTRKTVITGLMVYSQKYNLLGCIDTLDIEHGVLTERKNSVTAIYDGFKYQLYAQYAALLEMGYVVNELRLYSKKDNTNYGIPLPQAQDWSAFERVLSDMRTFVLDTPFTPNPNKCMHCIYAPLCDKSCVKENADALLS